MRLTRREALAGLAGATALPFPTLAQSGPFTANTYGGRWEAFWRNQLMPRFSQAIGRPTRLDVGLGASWITGFRAAGKANPPFTSLMANDRYMVLLREEGFFEPLPAASMPNLANVAGVARFPGDIAVTGLISPIGIAYRTDMVKTPPEGWADLWNPAYKGQLGLYSITNSASIMLLMWAGKRFGRGQDDVDAAVAKFAELKPFPQVAFSGQMAPLLTQGQVAMAPIDIGEVIPLKRRGVPVEFVIPEDGLMMYDQTFSILGGGNDKAVAARYIDYILSPEVQLQLAREFFVAPVNTTVTLPPDLAESLPITPKALEGALRFDWALAARLNEAMSERWSKAI
jgi:putative spermidine/putrescine transport system substrate-binding protein